MKHCDIEEQRRIERWKWSKKGRWKELRIGYEDYVNQNGAIFSIVLSDKRMKYDLHILAVNWKQEVETGLAMPFGLKALPWRTEGFVDLGKRDDVMQLVPELQLVIKADVPYD